MEAELSEETPVAVLETGACVCKAGLAGDKTCSVVFPSVVARSKNQDPDQPVYSIGHAAESCEDAQDLIRPVKQGAITDLDGMEQLWAHAFRELRINPQDVGVLCMDKMCSPKADREKTCQVMFEKFNIQGLYIMRQATLALYASGRTTGTVVDSGYDVTEVVPVYDGTELPHAAQKLPVGGQNLTLFLSKLLKEKQAPFAGDMKIMDNLKHRLCYVAEEFEAEQSMFEESTKEEYTLPDGSTVTLGTESFTVPEAMLRPSLLGLDRVGLAELVIESIRKCDVERRREMMGNIILSGSNMMFKGLSGRLQEDIKTISSSGRDVKVVSPPERNKSVWLGGSIVGSLSMSYKNMITKHEYSETGPSIVYSKC